MGSTYTGAMSWTDRPPGWLPPLPPPHRGRALIVLGLILGPLAERNFRRSMEIGGLATIYTSPIAVFLILAAVAALVVPRVRSRVKARRSAQASVR